MDQDTQKLDDNNPKSEAIPEVASDTGQELPPESAAQAQGTTPSTEHASPEPVSSMSGDERKAALEAIIYAADEPATIEQLAKALGEPKAAVQAALDELVASYASDTRGIEVRGVAGGYKMYTKPQHHDLVRRFIKSLRPPLRLTMPALETLAVISYKQPVTAPEIQEIRGVNTSGVIKTLLDKKLITTAGRKEVIGRPILYRTSKEFLMRFGLSDLGELPSLKEFEALAREALGTDEGVAESDAGDESVLDSMEPTEAEAAAELEASASEGSAESATASGEGLSSKDEPSASEKDSVTAQSIEQAIAPVELVEAQAPTEETQTPAPQSETAVSASDPVADAISGQAAESPATSEPEMQPAEAFAEARHGEGSQEASETASERTESVAQAGTASESHEESAHAFGSSVEAPGPSTGHFSNERQASTEYQSFTEDHESEQEISDEILAQLTQGIEIEVSADSLAALSGGDVPAADSPAQFYSSDAEPEGQPLPSADSTERSGDQSQPPNGEAQAEPEKSRKAAAGE